MVVWQLLACQQNISQANIVNIVKNHTNMGGGSVTLTALWRYTRAQFRRLLFNGRGTKHVSIAEGS